MSANYWESSQKNSWSLDKWKLLECRKEDLKFVTEKQLNWLYLYYSDLTIQLGKKLGVRQQVTATALVYFRRYYSRNSLRSTDPVLVIATCMFLATKVEECPHHIKNVVEGMKGIMPEVFPYESTHIADFEFYLLEEMDFYMVLYHAYRPLTQYLDALRLSKPCLANGWAILNDIYRSPLPLLHPPHMIALAAIYVLTSTSEDNLIPQLSEKEAAQVAKVDIAKWFAELQVDMEVIIEIAAGIIELYRDLEEYDETMVPELVRRLNAKV